jgi:hypothetical protein
MSKKKKRRYKERERADRDTVSLDALNAFRLVNGHEPLESLPLDFNPNLASAPSLVSPFPNEGAPLQGSSDTTPLERLPEDTPLKGSQASAPLKRTLLEEEAPQASPEEETVLDTMLAPAEEDSASELDWGNDTAIASAILGMGKLEDAATSEELVPPSNEDWTFDELPQARRAESEGTMVLSSAGNHMIWVPNHGLVRKSPPVLQAHPPYPIFGEEHNHNVDYTEDSPNEDGGTLLESPAVSSEGNNPAIVQNNGKEEAEPEARLIMGAGATTIVKRNTVLTQTIMLDLAATKQIRLHTPLLDQTQQQAGLQEDIYDYDELDGYTSPGGTIRMDKKLATVVFIAVAAETPNKLLLKARQEAYEQVTTQAKDLLERQRKAYEDQCVRMAEEHQRCMERMKAESDKMLEEASKVRQEYAQAFLLEEPPTIRKIEKSQAHIYYDSLSEQLEFKTQRLQNDYESEKKKRVRKEEDLKDAEDQITKLQQDLKRLKDILERSSKRSVPLRSKHDSPEMQPSKKKQIVEVQANMAAIIMQKDEINRDVESAGGAIIRQEPELRLDSLGDIVSNEVELLVPPTLSEIGRQAVEARLKVKLGESERIAALRRFAYLFLPRRKASVVTKTATNITKSPSPEKYLGLDKAAQDRFRIFSNIIMLPIGCYGIRSLEESS